MPLKVSDRPWIVAQICNLPYRRFAIGWLSDDLTHLFLLMFGRIEFCIARYSRLELRYFLGSTFLTEPNDTFLVAV
jgi:hypothetical protein